MHRDPKDPEYLKIPPATIGEFRGVPPTEEFVLPERCTNRYCTDVVFLVVFLAYMATMIALAVYVCWDKRLPKNVFGADECGNICGINNTEIESSDISCHPQDYTEKPILLYLTVTSYRCIRVEECQPPDRELILQRCFPNYMTDKLQEAAIQHKGYQTLYNYRYTYILIAVVTVVLCYINYLFMYIKIYIAKICSTVVGIIFLIIVSLVSWYFILGKGDWKYIVTGVFSFVLLASNILLFLFLCNRVKLILRLHMEVMKSILKSPILLLQPLMTIIFVFGLNALAVFIDVLLRRPVGYDPTRPSVIFFMFFTFYWLYGVANGCQCMIAAGVISAHYFTRPESPKPRLPWLKSTWVTFRYHLGTIAIGSVINLLMRGLKPLFGWARKNRSCCGPCRICSQRLREISEYWNKKAYIMTALHGRDIYPSGRRAARLLWLFLCDFISIHGLACACMHAMSFFFIICALMISLAMNSQMVEPSPAPNEIQALLYGAYFAGIITFFYVTLINTTVETLVVCFCEDRLLNDGSRNQPYFMSSELFAIMIESLELEYRENAVRSEDGSINL